MLNHLNCTAGKLAAEVGRNGEFNSRYSEISWCDKRRPSLWRKHSLSFCISSLLIIFNSPLTPQFHHDFEKHNPKNPINLLAMFLWINLSSCSPSHQFCLESFSFFILWARRDQIFSPRWALLPPMTFWQFLPAKAVWSVSLAAEEKGSRAAVTLCISAQWEAGQSWVPVMWL